MWRVVFLILFLTTVASAGPEVTLTPRLSEAISFNLFSPIPPTPVIQNNIENFLNPCWRLHIPGASRIEYVGLHGMFFSQLNRRIKAQGRSNLRREYNNGMLGDIEFRQRMEVLEYSMEDQWYDRSWYHSLPPEKGGAPKNPVRIEVGWQIRFEAIPVISWIHKKIQSLGDIWIEHDHYFDDQEDGLGLIRPDRREDNSKNDHDKLGIDDPLPDIVVIQDRWYKSSAYHLRFKPSARFRPTNDASRIIDEVGFKFLIELFVNGGRRYFADLVFFISHDIPKNNTIFTVALQLANF